MKIAVATTGKDLSAPVDTRFGRARGFLIVDTESDSFDYLENGQNLNATQGAGVQAAQTVAAAGAEMVLAGHCGPKAFRALSSAGVKVVVGAEGPAADAIDKVKSGELVPAEQADVQGRWT